MKKFRYLLVAGFLVITLMLSVPAVLLHEPVVSAATGKDVTKSKKADINKIVQACNQWMGLHIIEDHKFTFDGRTKTAMACSVIPYDEMNYDDEMGSYFTVSAAKAEMKALFGSNKDFTLKKTVQWPNSVYVQKGSKVYYQGGDWGEAGPYSSISRITDLGEGKYQVVVKMGLEGPDKNYEKTIRTYYGSYTMTLKESDNTYGYIIQKIVRGKTVKKRMASRCI